MFDFLKMGWRFHSRLLLSTCPSVLEQDNDPNIHHLLCRDGSNVLEHLNSCSHRDSNYMQETQEPFWVQKEKLTSINRGVVVN